MNAKPEPRARLRVFLCGDVMTGRGLDQILPHPGPPELRERYVRSAADYVRLAERANGAIPRPVGFAYPWRDALAAWRRMRPDVRLVNLETAITLSGDFALKGINYRMHPDNAPVLTAAGVHACALANNHLLDFGPAGLAETLAALRRQGIATAGAGRDLAEASAPAAIEGAGARLLVFSVASGDSGVPPDWAARPGAAGVARVDLTDRAAAELAARIRQARRPSDLVVVSIHWGSNWGYQVPDAHRRFAHALVDSGEVAVIHGHSSHHPRPIEVRRGRLILYGCGDFLNDYEGIGGYEEFRPELVAMYFADLDRASGALQRLVITPLVIRRFQLNEAKADDAAWLARVLSRESAAFGVRFTAVGARLIEATWITAG